MRVTSIAVCLFCLPVFAQDIRHNAVVDYKIYNNTDSPNTLYGTLFIDGPVTIFLTRFSVKVYNKPEEEASYTNRIITDIDYLMTDHKKEEILFFDYLGGNTVFIKDEYAKLNWNITEETKTIGEYSCIKAITSYRGREWMAWFTPDIPLPYGPWKLHGLPGLVMEAADMTNKYVWVVEKIDYRRDAVFDVEFSKLVKAKNKKPMTIRDYVEDKAELDANEDAKWLQENPPLLR